MKKYFIILSSFGLLTTSFLQTGCKKGYLDSYPKNNLTEESYYKTEGDFNNAVNAVYDAWQSDRLLNFFPMADIATPFAGYGSSRFGQYDNGIFGITDGWQMGREFWEGWYKVVFRANLVLDNIDKPGLTLDKKVYDRVKGEALFLRALTYFHLTYLYGDVPLVTRVLKFEEQQVSRDPHAKVVEQIINDLKTAETLLPSVTEYRSNKSMLGRASRGAAKSLLGKVYVYEKKWPEAEAKFNEIVNIDKEYDLEPNFLDLFWPQTENGKESIFEIQYQSGLKEGNSIVRFCAPDVRSQIQTAGFGYITPTEYYLDQFETVNGYAVNSTFVKREAGKVANFNYTFTYASNDPAYDATKPYEKRDPRLAWTAWYENTPYITEFQKRTGQSGVKYIQDYSFENGHNTVKYIIGKLDPSAGDSPGNLILIRFADVLLLYAETLIENNKLGDAVALINRVRQRPSVNMPTVEQVSTARGENISGDKALLKKYLMQERYRELAFEWGHMYMDQVRWDVFADEMVNFWTAKKYGGNNPALGSFDKKHYLWPIPAEERSRNPKLSQNDGY
ncbi:RagB/SusD family nutrient uptake outer membrane protein [Pseudoflavitalea sp. G-6-1-2]|uniref:RagB/SusD family nutrient uptake outer membrane protein n=1 Tax=Pseudoflavitalea sp. G-6-1-2 TaxID=2728841 RepID=UPI00146AA1B8|nr:RagB/SusD family nutrient uptake outer membrane protein [Pseudoflavitalea sp. G-6-1-2]NML24112.1 RagB/SusD family nutrient uptake outer membrane protein [Pseudoflavitalea sp. G-6-1-2]